MITGAFDINYLDALQIRFHKNNLLKGDGWASKTEFKLGVTDVLAARVWGRCRCHLRLAIGLSRSWYLSHS